MKAGGLGTQRRWRREEGGLDGGREGGWMEGAGREGKGERKDGAQREGEMEANKAVYLA